MGLEIQEDDATIALMMMNGDELGLSLLVKRHKNTVVGFLRKHLGRTALAEEDFEDAAWRALQKLHENIASYDDKRAKLVTLWCRYAYTSAIDILRGAKSELNGHRLFSLDEMQEHGRTVSTEKLKTPLSGKQRKQLCDLIETLSGQQKQIILSDLAAGGGLPNRELAERIGAANANTVQVQRWKAIQKLKVEAKRLGFDLGMTEERNES